MASTIVTKNSSTASAVPVSGDLTQGELAVNVTDKRLFTKNSGGTVVELGTNPASLALPNGTANGVAYLNGSKVVTTGSALTFDGTNLTVPAEVYRNTATSYVRLAGGDAAAAGAYVLAFGQSHASAPGRLTLGTTGVGPIIFDLNGSEQMRLTSTGLGIGTSSPAYKLQVAGVISSNDTVRVSDGTTTTIMSIAGTGEGTVGTSSNHSLQLRTNNTTKATLDSSGNLGLGVTPSAWGGTFRTLQFTGAASIGGTTDPSLQVSQNAYYNGTNWIYSTTAAASNYNQAGGAHAWRTAASGTAGNAITFTQAMTLDASGNLGIGTTSPANKLDVRTSGTNDVAFIVTSSGGGSLIKFSDGNTSVNPKMGANANDLVFATNTSGSATERARIDSSGNLLVGATAVVGSERLNVTANTGSYNARFINSNASPYGPMVNYSGAAPNGTSNECWRFEDTGGLRFQVRSNGGVVNYSANNVNLSDRREKTNFAPAGDYLAKICAIPVQTFNYIDQNMEDDPGLTLGVVAQDVEAVAPELVKESNWGTEEEPKMRLSIYQTDLQYALMKALQELKAEFDAYKATHP